MRTYALVTSSALFLCGCVSSFDVSPPVPSGLTYVETEPPRTLDLVLVDQRTGDGRTFSSGTISAPVRLRGAAVDPPGFLAEHVSAELASRRLPVRVSVGSGAGDPRIELQSFRIQNYRRDGWTAFFASTFISADLVTGGVTKRIGVFVRRGKLPMWSFDEVNEPAVGVPLSLAVKDFASKLANRLYGYRAPDAKVQELVARLAGSHGDESFLDVYELGFTNNPLAIEPVAGLVSDGSEYVRIAAISSLGTLRAADRLGLLQSLYTDRHVLWQERAMALKSIADLDTDASNAYIREEHARLRSLGDRDSLWLAQVLDLYL